MTPNWLKSFSSSRVMREGEAHPAEVVLKAVKIVLNVAEVGSAVAAAAVEIEAAVHHHVRVRDHKKVARAVPAANQIRPWLPGQRAKPIATEIEVVSATHQPAGKKDKTPVDHVNRNAHINRAVEAEEIGVHKVGRKPIVRIAMDVRLNRIAVQESHPAEPRHRSHQRPSAKR